MKKNGFTLVELLAVIVLMAILITIAVPGVTRVSKSLKIQSFCSKITIIESAALEYANDYFTGQENETSEQASLDNVSLMDLVNMGYLKTDSDIRTLNDLNDKEKEDKNKGKKFCILYDENSGCLLDPRDNSSMDYNLVRIWSANNRLYSSYLYKASDVYDNAMTSGVCGDNTRYIIDTTSDTFNNYFEYSSLGDFGLQTNVIRPLEDGKYWWSTYKNYRLTRPDTVPGNYYISTLNINYSLGSNTIMQINGGDVFGKNDITNGTNYSVGNDILKGKYLSNIDLNYRVALNKDTRVKGAYGKINKITVTWQKIS